ncbi:MAG: hypothetical protein F6K50_02660 [Moorea sp. SIO3I7]|nr:hypothetical protein [Moorena sp. SIO3I7]
MTKLAVDFGNGFSNFTDGEQTVSLRSRYEYSSGFLKSNSLESITHRIKYLDSDNSEQMICVGGGFGGIPTYETTKPTAAEHIFPALLIGLAQKTTFNSIDLIVIDTNPNKNQPIYEEKLLGKHSVSYIFNDVLQTLNVEVNSVVCVQEGVGAFKQYVKINPITKPNGLVGVQNVGAGTMDLLLFNKDGKCVAKQSLENRGCLRFAQWFSTQLRNSGVIEFDKEPSEMFQVLESQKLQLQTKNTVMESTTISVANELKTASKDYYYGGCKKMLQALEEFKPYLEKIVFTGGLANNISLGKTETNKVAISQNPLLDNVLGVL